MGYKVMEIIQLLLLVLLLIRGGLFLNMPLPFVKIYHYHLHNKKKL